MSITAGAAAIMGGAALASGALSALSGEKAVKRQIAWERERAQNAHQWEIQDLKAAGLNPILSAGGQGATTGGVSAPVPDYSAIPNAANAIVTAGLEQERVNNETVQTGADVNLKAEQAAKTAAETITEMYKQGLLNEQQANTAIDSLQKQKNIEQMENQIQISKKQYDLAEKQYKTERDQIEQEISKAKIAGRKMEAETLEQELRNKDYNFYKYRDTIFGIWDRVNDTVDTFRNNKPQGKKEEKTRKETWIKKNGQWVNTALIVGSRLI